MTEREIFETFISWMGFKPQDKAPTDDGGVVVVYEAPNSDENKEAPRMSCVGYESFWAGAVFSKDGSLVKGYLDSHVAHSSRYSDDIDELIKQLKGSAV